MTPWNDESRFSGPPSPPGKILIRYDYARCTGYYADPLPALLYWRPRDAVTRLLIRIAAVAIKRAWLDLDDGYPITWDILRTMELRPRARRQRIQERGYRSESEREALRNRAAHERAISELTELYQRLTIEALADAAIERQEGKEPTHGN